MSTTRTDLDLVQAEATLKVKRTLRGLKRHYGATDDAIATALGGKWTRSKVQERLAGATKLDVGDLTAFAYVFGLEGPHMLFWEVNDVLRWTLDTNPDLPMSWSTCSAAA